MKLSEILAKPIKLKGGGILNLKGFNKRVIDKEVGENPETNENIITTLSTILGIPVINQEFVADYHGNLIKINELPITEQSYFTLIKKSDYETLSNNAHILNKLNIMNNYFSLNFFVQKDNSRIIDIFNIDGETYCSLEEMDG